MIDLVQCCDWLQFWHEQTERSLGDGEQVIVECRLPDGEVIEIQSVAVCGELLTLIQREKDEVKRCVLIPSQPVQFTIRKTDAARLDKTKQMGFRVCRDEKAVREDYAG